MFNEFDPYAELQQLRLETMNQRNLINQLITNNNKLQDLLMELSNQHQSISHEYGNFNRRLKVIEAATQFTSELNSLKK